MLSKYWHDFKNSFKGLMLNKIIEKIFPIKNETIQLLYSIKRQKICCILKYGGGLPIYQKIR